MSDESSLPLISFFDMNIIIPLLYIEFDEDFCILEFINEIQD